MKVITTSANKTFLYETAIYSTHATYFAGRKKLYTRHFLESLKKFYGDHFFYPSNCKPDFNQNKPCCTMLRGIENLKHLSNLLLFNFYFFRTPNPSELEESAVPLSQG